MNEAVAVIVGVGPSNGLGAALVRRTAQEGLTVLAVARSRERLTAVTAATECGQGSRVVPVQADATQEADVITLFDTACSGGRELALVVYNVGANAMVPFLDLTPEFMEQLWRQNCLGGFLVGREAARRMVSQKRGTIIFTGATASLRARPPFCAFASAKAALRAVAQSMAREFGPQGIHVAHTVIDGVIDGDYARSQFSEFVTAKGTDGLMSPEHIADAYWRLHRQPRSAWTHELDLRPFCERF